MRISGYGSYGVNRLDRENGGSALERFFGYKKGSTSSNKNESGSSNSSTSSSAISKALALYDATKKGADGVQEHGTKLTDQKEGSLFAKAKESKKTEDVVKEIESFISDYNNMVNGTKQAGGRSNIQYSRQLRNDLNIARKDLRKIGITYGSDGTLEVDMKKLNAASVEDLEQVFSTGTLMKNTMQNSELIEKKALENKESLTAASSSTYNKYGSYNNNSYLNYRG